MRKWRKVLCGGRRAERRRKGEIDRRKRMERISRDEDDGGRERMAEVEGKGTERVKG